MSKKFFVAGGKTGGHLFPGIAIAEAVLKRYPQVEPVFIGVKDGLEARVVPQKGWRVHFLPIRPLVGRRRSEQFVAFFLLPFAFLKALGLLIYYRPKVVVGVGGYASFPITLLAGLLRFPTIIQEQNSVLGRANQFLLPWVRLVYMPSIPAKCTSRLLQKLKVVGNPIRADFLKLANLPAEEKKGWREDMHFNILLVGGSQGAKFLNEQFLVALPSLKQKIPNLRILHQTGAKEFDSIVKAYQILGVEADIRPFIDNMAEAYAACHLVITRAGAGIYEANALGRAGIYIPIARSSGDHQKQNALVRVAAGAGFLLEEKNFNLEEFVSKIATLAQDSEQRMSMEKASQKLFLGDAASTIAKDLKIFMV